MSLLSNSIRAFILVFLLSAAAIPAHADGVDNPTYLITGVMIFTGNNTCTPAPCSESIAFSFDLNYVLEEGQNGVPAYDAFASNITDTWTGDLATFTETSTDSRRFAFIFPEFAPPNCAGPDLNFLEFADPGGDEVDLHLCDNDEATPVVPSLDHADIFRCFTDVCTNEFPDGIDSGPISAGVLKDVTVTKEVPEPASFLLLGFGVLSLGLIKKLRFNF